MIKMNTGKAHPNHMQRALIFILTLSVIVACILGISTEEVKAGAETVTVQYGSDIWYGSEWNGVTAMRWVTHINGEAVDLDEVPGVSRSYAYCVQPMVYAPPAGTYPVTVVDDDGSGKVSKMRKLIYYLPGSYGYTKISRNRWFGDYSLNDSYALGHLGLSWIYDNYNETNSVWGGAPDSTRSKVRAIVGDLDNLQEPPEDFEVFWIRVSGQQDIFGAFYHTEYGNAGLLKSSSMTRITQNNAGYSLAGAEYTIYEDSDCTTVARSADGNPAIFITKEDGSSDEIRMETGNYYVKETKAPKGYAIDEKARLITVIKDKTSWLNVQEEPRHNRIKVLLRKLDAGSGKSEPQGDASIAGAVYRFRYYDGYYQSAAAAESSGSPTATWHMSTSANGEISGSSPTLAASYNSSELFKDSEGNIIFLLGTYLIQEVKAPAGYLINNETLVVHITDDGSEGRLVSTYNENTSSSEAVIRGGVRISKIDNDLDEARSQGDASLAGAEFTIYNKSKSSIVVNGRNIPKDGAALVIRTDESGRAASAADALPYGTYSIKETKAPAGYKLNDKWSESFSIRENGQIIDLSSKAVRESVIRGGVQIVKRDKELGKSEALGGANLEGVVMTIRNVSGHDVVVSSDLGNSTEQVDWSGLASKKEKFEDGSIKRIASGEDVGQIITHWNEEKRAYTAETSANDLPYGRYTIRESKTSASYQRTDKKEHAFEIREDGVLYSFDGASDDALSFDNYVYRSDVQGTKIGDGDSSRFANIPFKITSVSNGETHVVVTDKNGFFSTRDRRTADELDEEEGGVTDRRINPFDDLLESEDILRADLEARAAEIRMGVWFGTGEFESTAEEDGSAGALPYDSYVIEEIKIDANEGYDMQKFFFTVDEKSRTGLVDLETITNDYSKVPEIGTEASVGGEQRDVDPAEEIVLTDVIHYEGLKWGQSYTIKGRLMDKSTGEAMLDAKGEEITAETEFKTLLSAGKTKVIFTFDGSRMHGADTVVYERLYDSEGTLIARHEDIESESQRVSWKEKEPPEIPKIPKVTETPKTPEIPEIPEAPETPEVPEAPEVPVTPEVPETPEVPKTPQQPGSPKTGDDFSKNLLYLLLALAASAEGLLLTKKRRNDRLN